MSRFQQMRVSYGDTHSSHQMRFYAVFEKKN